MSITDNRHSPKQWDEYMNKNISLYDIVEYQKELLEYQTAVLTDNSLKNRESELTVVNDWLLQTTVLLEERLLPEGLSA